MPPIHPETPPILLYVASGTGSSSAKTSNVGYCGKLSTENPRITLDRTSAVVLDNLANSNPIDVDLVMTDIVEGASVSVRVLRVLKHRHC